MTAPSLDPVPGAAPCPICGTPMAPAGTKRSAWSQVEFALARCPACRFAHVVEPRTDFAALYDVRYYRGEGADPMVDYLGELDDPHTVRAWEWQGIERLVGELVPLSPETRWLDLGCGTGGLVRELRRRGFGHAVGHDEGFGAEVARSRGIPVLDAAELAARGGGFDVVTSVEVVEHAVDPMAFLRQVSGLLAPGGVFVLTTGNVERVDGELARWPYVLPDIHVSFLGPTSLREAYARVGLDPVATGFRRPHVDIIRYKILKTIGSRRARLWQRAVPWAVLARLADRGRGVSDIPHARKPQGPSAGRAAP